jgi:hypothetical protein
MKKVINLFKRTSIIFKRTSFRISLKIVVNHLTMKFFNIPGKILYSSFGEDIILFNLFSNKTVGNFIDVGCNRPIDGNNTFNLYIRGWSGLNIDGNQSLINEYKKSRPYDTSICALVSNQEVELPFYISKIDAVSTINKDFLDKHKNTWEYSEEDIVIKKTRTLTQILDDNLYVNKTIDLLSIDIEGHDFEALLGLDLNKYRPSVICIEIHDFDFNNLKENKIVNYLNKNNYSLCNYTILSAFFAENNFLKKT